MDKYLSLIIIQNYSIKQRFLRMILKNLISMKSPSLTKRKRNPANEKLIYLIFKQGHSIILFLRKNFERNSLLKNHNSFFNVQFIKIYLESPLLCGLLLFYALMFECLRPSKLTSQNLSLSPISENTR